MSDSLVSLAWLRLYTCCPGSRPGAFAGSLTVRPVKSTMFGVRMAWSMRGVPFVVDETEYRRPGCLPVFSAPADFYRGHMWPALFLFSNRNPTWVAAKYLPEYQSFSLILLTSRGFSSCSPRLRP
jgi:hypothetical protein